MLVSVHYDIIMIKIVGGLLLSFNVWVASLFAIFGFSSSVVALSSDLLDFGQG